MEKKFTTLLSFMAFIFLMIPLNMIAQCPDGGGGPVCYSQTSTLEPIVLDLCPQAGNVITINFTGGEVENGWDALEVYEGGIGTGSNGSIIYSAFGNAGDLTGLSVQAITPGNCINVYVDSDDSYTCFTEGFAGITWTTSCAPPPPPPGNDLCGGAEPVEAAQTYAGNNGDSVDDSDHPGFCGLGTGETPGARGLWYKYESTANETVTLDLCTGTTFDTKLHVYSGSCAGLICVASNDDACSLQSQVEFTTTAGSSLVPETYHILVTGFGAATGDFTLNVLAAALPVELAHFGAKSMETANKIMWTTATEENTEYHAIERSPNGESDWKEIGQVKANGNSQFAIDYEWMDEKPYSKSYYRLRSVDYDGKNQVSDVAYVERSDQQFGIIGIRPVPTQGEAFIDFESVRNERVTIQIMDLSGKLLFTESFDADNGYNSRQLDLSQFGNGVYFVSLENSVQKITQRIIKN